MGSGYFWGSGLTMKYGIKVFFEIRIDHEIWDQGSEIRVFFEIRIEHEIWDQRSAYFWDQGSAF